MVLRTTATIIVTAAALSTATSHQKSRIGSLTRNSDELTMPQATSKAAQILNSIGFQAPEQSRWFVSVQSRGIFGREVRVWEIMVRDSFRIDLDTKTGTCLAFFNRQRLVEQHLGKNRTKSKFFTTQQEAKSKLVSCAAKFSMPTSWQIDRIEIKGDDQTERSSHGFVGARYKDSNGEICASLSLDIQDGQLLDFTRRAP